MSTTESVYSRRFSDAGAAEKHAMWGVIGHHLQRYVPDDAVVLDLACDRGYFLEHVEAREKWASDIRGVDNNMRRVVRAGRRHDFEPRGGCSM